MAPNRESLTALTQTLRQLEADRVRLDHAISGVQRAIAALRGVPDQPDVVRAPKKAAAPRRAKGTIVNSVLGAMNGEAMTPAAVADAIGEHTPKRRMSIGTTMIRMSQDGRLEKVGQGLYRKPGGDVAFQSA